jgi:hypothetical protein
MWRSIYAIESDLRRARTDVFSDDTTVAAAAERRIPELLAELSRNPDEVRRRADLAAARDEALLRRWA